MRPRRTVMHSAAGTLFILKSGNDPRCRFVFPECPVRKLSAMGHCGGSHKAHRFYFDGQTLRRYVFRRSQYHRPAIVPYIPPFGRHDLSEPFRALYVQYAAKISEAVQTTKNASEFLLKRFAQVGDYLFSRAVSSELSSAQVSLTSVFGMGTGGTSPSSTPTDLTGLVYHNWSTLSSVS